MTEDEARRRAKPFFDRLGGVGGRHVTLLGFGFVTPSKALQMLDAGVAVPVTDEELVAHVRSSWCHDPALAVNPDDRNIVCVVLWRG